VMKVFRSIILFILILSVSESLCQSTEKVEKADQSTEKVDKADQSTEKVEMADVLRQDGKIYTVVFGLVVILTAMIILLIRVDRKVFRLEKEMKKDK